MVDPFIDKVRQIILDHLDDEKFGVSELASAIGLSKSQALRKIKSLSNKSINQFIKETRLEEAAKLILNSDLLASEISYKVGFSSPSYFNKCFNKYYGITPGEYKEKGKELPFPDPFDQQTFPSRIKKFQFVYYTLGAALLLFVIFVHIKNKSSESKIDPTKKSIAVLYFDDNSRESDQKWFLSGITEEIRSKLSNIERLKVTSSTSVKQFRNIEKTIPEIAKELGVDYILEGSVTIYNNKIKIIAQLINANDEHIWSKEFNDDMNDIFDIQQNVAKDIAQQLKIDLSPEEIKILEKYPTDNMEAYNLFLQAEYQKSLFNKIAYNKALPLYEQAIALDSNFVEAYIGLSDIWQVGGIVWGLYDEKIAWKNSKQLLLKASSIDSSNIQIEYNLHFGQFYYEWDFESMEKYYQKRLLKANYSILTGIIQDYAIKTGRYNEALLINEKYIANAPSISYIYAYKAEILMFLGRKDEALEILTKYDSVYNDDMFYLRESTKVYFYLEEYERSKNQLKKIRIKFPNDNPSIFIWLDAVFAQMEGKTENAELYLEQLINRYETTNLGSPAWFIAIYYGYFKDYENAFTWLQKSYDRHEVEMTWLREEPILIPVRNDDRYKELYHNMGFSKIN
jgi:TolB-like protein/AraC-like DNA-binding protein